jgi:hypothetical protein
LGIVDRDETRSGQPRSKQADVKEIRLCRDVYVDVEEERVGQLFRSHPKLNAAFSDLALG